MLVPRTENGQRDVRTFLQVNLKNVNQPCHSLLLDAREFLRQGSKGRAGKAEHVGQGFLG